jgi:hypothetical protein
VRLPSKLKQPLELVRSGSTISVKRSDTRIESFLTALRLGQDFGASQSKWLKVS